jgi:UDP-N-acetylglucosamine acyltransferase
MNTIHPTAIIGDNVILGDNNYIGAYCIIGDNAEYKKYWGKKGRVVIGNNNIITGLVTIDAGAEIDTLIGNDCFIMKHAHVGHDCIIQNNVTISCGAKIGGHTIIKKNCNIGLNAVIHQNQIIEEGCMIGALCMITKKIETKPYTKYAGVPAKEIGSNENMHNTTPKG